MLHRFEVEPHDPGRRERDPRPRVHELDEASRVDRGVASEPYDEQRCFPVDRLHPEPAGAHAGAAVLREADERRVQRSVAIAYLFEGGNLAPGGALLLAVGGGWTVHPVVSQGAAPIGESWTITEAERNIVVAIGGRPALDVLMETLRALPPDVQERAGRNLLCGLAMDEYADELGRGDFLIRNLLGVDRERGAVAINDNVRVGQTLQFQLRDAEAATEEFNALLDKAREAMGGEPAGGLLCACNGRGQGMFGAPDHDAAAVADRLGPVPIAGLFCNGEIGPVGGTPFVHGFTASLALFVPVGERSGE